MEERTKPFAGKRQQGWTIFYKTANNRATMNTKAYKSFGGVGLSVRPRRKSVESMIKVGKFNENSGWDIAQPLLKTVILRLRYMQKCSQLALRQIVILSHIANTAVVCHKMSS